MIPIGALYGAPTVPFGRGVGEIVNGPPPPLPVIVMLTGLEVVSCGFELSLALTVRFVTPATVGVPLTVQVFGASVNPAGSVPVVMVQE